MPEPDDTASTPGMRRMYALAILTECIVVAALWAMKRFFS